MTAGGNILLVTGGSRGIGAAVVRAAAGAGYAVCFSYRRDEGAARRLVDELGAGGHAVHAFCGDVADPDFSAAFFDHATNRLGAPGFLVNNAGITGGLGEFRNLAPEALRRTVDVNLVGLMSVAQEAIRRWEAAGVPGRMVNVSSIAATLGAPGEYVHYAATKAAVEAFTVGLGKEVARSGIRVNAVAPGTTATDIHAAGGDPGRTVRVASRIPLGRVAEPDEIAGAILWLLSDAASYVTASVLRAGGGA